LNEGMYGDQGLSQDKHVMLYWTGCARGRSGTPQGPQRAAGDRQEADRRPRLGDPEEYKRSTRSPGGGAWCRSAGMRPENLRLLEDGLGKRLRPYFLKGFYDGHVKRYYKRPIYRHITAPRSLRCGRAHELEVTR